MGFSGRDAFFGAMEGTDREMELAGTQAHHRWSRERIICGPQGGGRDGGLRHR